jgi:hypothetical protein
MVRRGCVNEPHDLIDTRGERRAVAGGIKARRLVR